MREAAFIKENREKWDKIDYQGNFKSIPADVFTQNMIEVNDDLSFARSFYPNSPLVDYLNQLALKYFTFVSKYKKRKKLSIKKFWMESIPLSMYYSRKAMFLSLACLVISCCIGIFSMSQDTQFANLVLGESYVQQTMDNIAVGDPMAVYKGYDEGTMFMGISLNNILVAFKAFMYGIFISLGTYYILFFNGVMLGVFHYLFYKEGLLTTMLLSVWLHGTLEISAIIIAGGAGIVIGNSILYPKTYSRVDSLKKGASNAIKVLISLIPVFIVAAFIEGYITRLTEMSTFSKLTIIGISALFILWYYVLLPIQVKHKTSMLK